jgi:hypothetical protein
MVGDIKGIRTGTSLCSIPVFRCCLRFCNLGTECRTYGWAKQGTNKRNVDRPIEDTANNILQSRNVTVDPHALMWNYDSIWHRILRLTMLSSRAVVADGSKERTAALPNSGNGLPLLDMTPIVCACYNDGSMLC